MSSSIAINHACIHLAKPMFICRMCDHTSNSKSAILTHLLDAHQKNSSNEFYQDLSIDYLYDIKKILTRCFGKSMDSPPSNDFAEDCADEDARKK